MTKIIVLEKNAAPRAVEVPSWPDDEMVAWLVDRFADLDGIDAIDLVRETQGDRRPAEVLRLIALRCRYLDELP
jgi:hypothetical protein